MSFLDRLFGYNEIQKAGITLDVGTEFIKALVFKIEDGKATILGSAREQQALSNMQGGSVTDISGVVTTAEKAVKVAVRQANLSPQCVVMGIAGELVKGITTTITYTRKNPDKKIDHKELVTIMRRVQDKALVQAQGQVAWETGKEDIDLRLVNAAAVDVRIDRHQVTDPIGFVGKHVKVGVYTSFAPMVYLRALESVAEGLGLDIAGITAEPYAVARAVSGKQHQDFNAIIMDVGGGTTDIAVVRNGGLEGTKIFAIGGRTFTKRITQELNVLPHEAEDMKLEYSSGRGKKEVREKISALLKRDVAIWLSGVSLVLKEFGDSEPLPNKILLCGGGSMLPEIKHTLEGKAWTEELAFAKHPSVSFIDPSDVDKVTDSTGALTNPSDVTPMALTHLGIGLIEGEGVLAEVLRAAAKTMSH